MAIFDDCQNLPAVKSSKDKELTLNTNHPVCLVMPTPRLRLRTKTTRWEK